MNVFNKTLLKLALLPAPVYKKMGVNTHHLKAILTTKLIMDDRRPNGFQQMQQRKNKRPVSTATLSTMLMAVLAGSLFAVMSGIVLNIATRFTVYFSFYVTFLASILIADFTSVLIDVRDSYIILPKPVTDRTFVLSRLLHILIHICKISIPMALPGAIFFAIKYGLWGLLVFLPLVIMAVLFTIFLINACYILILKVTTPQKFQNIISYIQIAFAIFFYACYQLVPRMINQVSNFDISTVKGIMLLPTYWFAGAWQQLYSPVGGSIQLWVCLVLSFIVPLLSLWVVIKYFAPSFNQKLALISAGTGEGAAGDKTVKQEKETSSYSLFLANLFTKPGAERSGFLFTWRMMLRSREFKLKVYPAIGYMLVITVLMFFNMKGLSLHDISAQTARGKSSILIVIYFSNLLLISALGQITIHDKFKAAWIFFTTPVDAPGKIISGAVKASIMQFFLPLALAILIILVSLAGLSILPNALLGICNVMLLTSLSAYITANRLPFSTAPNIKQSRGMLRVFTVMIPGAVLGFLHYALYNIMPVVIILIFLSAGAAWMIFDSIKKWDWKKVKSEYED